MDYQNKSKEEIINELQELKKSFLEFKAMHEKAAAEQKINSLANHVDDKKYRQLAENMTDIIWEINCDLTFTFISSSIEKTVNFLPSELIGKKVIDFIEPSFVKPLLTIYNQRIETYRETGKIGSHSYEFMQRCKDGSYIWVEAVSNPSFNNQGELIGFQGITRNISEWKQKDAELKISGERLSKVFHSAPFVITILRVSDHKLIDVNIAAELITGFSREELLNNQSISIIIWADSGQRQAYFESIKNKEKLNKFEVKYKTHKGEIGSALLSTEYVILNGELCALGFFEVNTMHRQTEELLEESREKYRGLSEAGFDAILISENGICMEQNLQAELMFGYSNGEAAGKPGASWIVPEDRDLYLKNMNDGYKNPFRVTALRKDGSTFAALVRARMMNYKGKSVLTTSISDISQQIIAEQNLIESEKQFRLIFENNNDAIFWAEASTGNLIKCNKAAEKLVERSRSEIIGQHHSILHPREEMDKRVEQFQEHIRLKGNKALESDVITKSGKIKIVEVSSTVITIGGIEINQGIFKDISDIKRMDAALKNIVKASASSQSKNIFTTLVTNLAATLQVKYAFIGQLKGNEKNIIETIAICKENEILKNFEYDLEGTPCFDVLNQKACTFPNNVANLYPGDILLKKMAIEAYIGMPLKDNKGNILGIIVVFHDKEINRIYEAESILSLFAYRAASELERKNFEDTLLEAQANLLAIVENTNDNIWAIDTAYKLIFINGQFKRDFKASYGIELQPEMNILECLPKELNEIWKVRYDRALANERFEFEEKFIFGDVHIYVEVAMNPIIADGEIIGVSVFAHDISKRKLAELMILDKNNEIENQNKELTLAKEKLKLSEETYRGIIDSFSEAVYIQNLEGKFLEVNHSAEKMYGYNKDFFVGKTPEYLSAPNKNDLALLGPIIQKTLNGEPQTFEFWGKRFDDSIFPKEVSNTLGKYFGQKVIIAVARDISERKHAELILQEKNKEIAAQNEEYQQLNEELLKTNNELIKAKNKAEESDRLKTSFLQNMSHEIRTPMNAIMGFSSLLAIQYNNKPKLEQFSEIINNRCSDLLDIINDILDIAKIESGQLSTHIEEVDLNFLFLELMAFFMENQKRIGKSHINFNLQSLQNHSDNRILTDKVKLKQIFINLIGNAFKFTDNGKIEGGCRIENNMLIFYLSDTGMGIPEDKKEYIFERFAQLTQGQNKIYGGTGLGLSIVKGLVELLGGHIWLQSELGKGTTFYFSIPYHPLVNSKHTESQSIEFEQFKIPEINLLLVEDDFYNAKYLKEVLTSKGINILHAELGKKAVQIALTSDVDIILMDIRLPDIDGYEATRQIRILKPDVIIIAQTAYAANEDRIKALSSGFDDYISKPVKPDLLFAKILKLLSTK